MVKEPEEPLTMNRAPARNERGSGVQSIDRAVTILRCFSPRAPELGISDLARATGLSTSTVHRLLVALQHNGLVRQTAERRYVLGPLLMQLVGSGAIPASLRDAAMETMQELRDRVDETVGLHELLTTNQRAVIDQVESHHALRRTYTDLGMPIPLPHGAPGKAILAFVPREVSIEVLASPIEAATPATITDPQQLRVELEHVRADGFATSFSERTPGIHTVAAPIFGSGSRVAGCLSVSGPAERMPRSRVEALSVDVRRASWHVSEALGASWEGVQRCTERAAPPSSSGDQWGGANRPNR